ncbi:hypothetical protein BDK51DRAFT_22170, partial [Blyttiomyces helicus]
FLTFAVGYAGYLSVHNLRHQDVCWTKANRFPYESIQPNQGTKVFDPMHSFPERWSRSA